MTSTLTYNSSRWQWQDPSRPRSHPTPLRSISSVGTSSSPIYIPSDVDSDTEDSGDDRQADELQFDTSLPPASSLDISITRSQSRERADTIFVDLVGTQPVELPPLYANKLAIPNVIFGSPKSTLHRAINAPTSSSESSTPPLPHLDLDKTDCQENNPETLHKSGAHSVTPTLSRDNALCAANEATERPRTGPNCDADSSNSALTSPEPCPTPELPHEPLGHPTAESGGQASDNVDISKPTSVSHDDIQAAVSAPSLQKASDDSASAQIVQSPSTLLHMFHDSRKTSDIPLSTTPSRRSSAPKSPHPAEQAEAEAEQHSTPSSPPPSASMRRHLRRRAVSGSLRYDSDSDEDGDSQGSEADANCITCRPMSSTDEESERSDYDDRQFSRKRRRVSKLSTGSTSWRTGREKRSRASRIPSPAPSQPRPMEAEGAVLAKFEEWPLENAVLKRVTQNGKATFQIQFDWAPCTGGGHMGKAKRASGPKGKYTPQEDALLIKLKKSREKLTWPEIHQRFNEAFPERDRSQQSLQVHWCTKLKES
ncbi:hypothetical protein BGZ63DRAFT_99816 [Mariannaea sp. PMI_226]|nr:hypothetical protein BGZ63DRAFT_99816 [Mariannaea sp. PMI_226]